ncbi:hypothetical protein X566_21175 [Afipia sp. P52-10]|nr:hypothetical protein X566_21175 [Afipia sp. P52-10]
MRPTRSRIIAILVTFAVSLPAVAGSASALPQNARPASKAQAIKRAETGMNRNSELRMIQLQSAVSQRQSAVQMTTRMMRGIEDSRRQVLKNCPDCFR